MRKFFLPVFLCLFFLCGCTDSLPTPNFDFSAYCKTENFTGQVSCSFDRPIEVKAASPEEFSGMTAKVGNSIVSLSFAGITKSSERHPSVKSFSCSKIGLMLDDLRRAELNFSGKDEGRVAFYAETATGKYTLVTDLSGNILAVRNENSGFTVHFTY